MRKKSFTAKTFTHSAWSKSRVRRQNVLPIAKSHFQTNQKWKYGGTLIFKRASIDFLFDRNTNYGNRFHARNYFRFWRKRKYWHRTTAYVKMVSEPSTSEYRTITANFGQKTPFTTKPEVEIRRKLHTSTRNRWLPIRLQYNVQVYRPPFQR